MARFSEILDKKWPGQTWRAHEAYTDPQTGITTPAGIDYWDAGNTLPQPTPAEVWAFEAEVDALLAAERRLVNQQKLLLQADNILAAFEVLANAVADLQAKANITGTHRNRVTALIAKLADIRASI